LIYTEGLYGAFVEKDRLQNIILILSDDHGQKDSGCYGNSVVKTPNIDRIASAGMKFHRAFTPTAMCAPSRSTLFTGLYPHRHGCHMNHGSVFEEIKSLPYYLQPLGYRVGLSGKTHIKPRKNFPFEYLSLDISEIGAFIDSSGDNSFCLIIATHDPHAKKVKGEHGFAQSTMYDPGTIPLPPYLVDTEDTREQMAGYYDLITNLDNYIGDVLELLDDWDMDKQTVLIYTSDHGAGFPFEKWTCYEAGLTVPLLIQWRGYISPGSETKAMVSFADVLPTLIEIAGGNTINNLDGRSFLPVVTGEKSSHHQYIYGVHTTKGIIQGSYYPIRSVRDERFKYIRNLNPDGRFTNLITESAFQAGWGSWKKKAQKDPFAAWRVRLYQERPPEEVYDLKHGPYELHNLAGDSAYQEVKTRLSQNLDNWMSRQGDAELKS